MTGYVGNGTTAVATSWVFVGELTTNSANVTGAIAYAYAGAYTSPLRGWPASGQGVTVSHNLGVPPAFVDSRWRAVNISTDLSWPVGAEIDAANVVLSAATVTNGFSQAVLSKTQAHIAAIASFLGAVNTYGTGAVANVAAAKWNLRFYARRRF